MLHSLPALFGVAVAMLTCLAAMTLGGPAERFAGAVLLVVNFADLVIQSHSDWAGPQYAVLLVDGVSLLVALAMVVFTSRAWTIGFAAYQGLTVLTHLAMLLEPAGSRPEVRTWVYITGLVLWGYLIWACLLWGTFSAWRRRGTPKIPRLWRGNGSQGRAAKLKP